jgi:hypothetical protein
VFHNPTNSPVLGRAEKIAVDNIRDCQKHGATEDFMASEASSENKRLASVKRDSEAISVQPNPLPVT